VLSVLPIPGVGLVSAGDDLAALLTAAIRAAGLSLLDGDCLVVAQKVVSKAEGRTVDLATVEPSSRALALAAEIGKDPRLVELVLGESVAVVRTAPNTLIVRHRLGYVMANAGVDQSNLAPNGARQEALLLPVDPDASAAALRAALLAREGVRVGVIVSDSFGRPWRQGSVNIALGAAGVAALHDRRGERDLFGRPLAVTQVAVGDAIAAAAGLVMGEGAEGVPAAIVRGADVQAPHRPAADLIRPVDQDLFR
jgi:coenzyme F420-0:L-glutamate ligase/coenzyme F420-1:gamma-L-glutamate ligase